MAVPRRCLKCDKPIPLGGNGGGNAKYHPGCRPRNESERQQMATKAWNLRWGTATCKWCEKSPVDKGAEPYCEVCALRLHNWLVLKAHIDMLRGDSCPFCSFRDWELQLKGAWEASPESQVGEVEILLKSLLKFVGRNHRVTAYQKAKSLLDSIFQKHKAPHCTSQEHPECPEHQPVGD